MQSTETNHLMIKKEDGILSITLNRPDSLNAFSTEMISGISDAIREAKTDDTVRAVTIAGAGRAFSAGGDVKRMGSNTPMDTYAHLGNLNNLILSMKELEKPIIAVVHGYAAGAGFNLAMACDLILAEDDTRFIMSFSKVGLISDGGGLYFLTRQIGPYRAKELMFNAEPITAEEAYHLGIVNHVYPAGELKEKADNFVRRIAEGPSTAYGFIKKIADKALTSNLEEILEQERITQATVATSAEHREGVQAFKEKRQPDFKRSGQ
ncbi:enoyl-CoA hydratase/isomerase family protein [Virgibacillus xinjiangensis]|uniref:Enoyl-CoA hydratase/isomerase family protein n=1 Tax=Virgibacillus xinjiangensis TaxID=393090 RepID=A0ABV7D0X0_9BACI